MIWEKTVNKKTYACAKCGRMVEEKKMRILDDKPICPTCLYGQTEPFALYPIGTVRNNAQRREGGFGTAGSTAISCIDLIPSQKPFMYKLEEEQFLTIVYYLHKARPVKSVFRRGLDGKKVGVFASRTPDRLSRIAIQEVTLVKIEGMTLYVEGLDAIHGSPVLDIKLGRKALHNHA